MIPRSFSFVFALSFFGAISGCAGDASTPTETSARASAPIIDGVASTAEDDSAVWLGVLSSSGYPQGMCSGVLVADNVVLTARHCVARTQSGGIACRKDGTSIVGGGVLSDYDATRLAVLIGPKWTSKAAAKGKQVFHSGAKNLCNNDIAVVVLDRRIPDAKIAPIRLDAPPKEGETILAVGWGVSNNSRSYGRRRRADIPIVEVGPTSTSTGAVGPNEFSIGEGICQGDSGGPAYAMATGAVLGVVSRGGNGAPYDPETDPEYTQCVDTADYATHNLYTRVDTFKDLILEAFAAAESEPWFEGGPDPRKAKAGESCASGDACRSGICIEGENGNICADSCADAACPEGWVCHEASKICAPAPPPAAAADPAAETTTTGSCAASAPGAAATPGALGLVLALGLMTRRRARR